MEFLTTRAAAEAYGVDRRSIDRAVARGDIVPDSIHLGPAGEPTSVGFLPNNIKGWQFEQGPTAES